MAALTPPQTKAFPFTRGLDLITTPVMMDPGALIACQNMEMIAGKQGYSRLGGFEPYDGTELPSDAFVTVITVDAGGSGSSVIGSKYTSAGDPGTNIYPVDTVDLTTEDNVIPVYVEYGAVPVVGATFTDGTNSFVVKSSTTSLYAVRDDATEFYIAVVEMVRAQVEKVVGSGPVYGVVYFEGDVLGFRNDSSDSWGQIYKSSLNKYLLVDMPILLFFKDGLDSTDPYTGFEVGDVITNGSGASRTVTSVTEWGGSWSGAAPVDQVTGYLTFENLAGNDFFDTDILTSGDTTAVAVGDSYTYVLNKRDGSQRVEAVVYNYYADLDKNAVYGVDGMNYAFEYDGTTYIPIIPESHQDIWPTHIADHNEKLYLAYPGGDLIYSALITSGAGSVRVFNTDEGAGDWNTGREIVSLSPTTGGTLTVLCDAMIWILSGIATEERFTRFKYDLGAQIGSVAGRGDVVFVSGNSLFQLSTTQAFGDFVKKSIAPQIQPFIEQRQEQISCSFFCQKKSQYRMYFLDGSFLFITFDGSTAVGATTGKLPIIIRSSWSSMDSEGKEHMFIGSDDGFVYKMDSGDTFNDLPVTGFMRLPFYAYDSFRNWKQFINMILEMDSPVLLTDSTDITFSLSFDYGNADIPKGVTHDDVVVLGGGGYYSANDTYGSFIYSGQPIYQLSSDIEGVGRNMSILLNFETKYDKPFMFHACIIDYIPMGITW